MKSEFVAIAGDRGAIRGVLARFSDSIEQVPTAAVTMGIGTIMDAKQILLLACGQEKAHALKAALYGGIPPRYQRASCSCIPV